MPSLRTMDRKRTFRAGFTLVEVLFIAPFILLVIAVFVGIIISLTGEVLVARSANQVTFDTQNALEMIEQDVLLSGSFLATNNITPQTPQGLNNTAAAFVNTSAAEPKSTLILNAIATSNTSNAYTVTPVWIKDAPNPCGAQASKNTVMTYNIVYFLRDGTLWRRTIMPSRYSTAGIGCSQPDQKPSCSTVAATPANPCMVRDTLVLANVATFSVEYFTSAGQTSPVANAANASVTAPNRQTALNSTDTAKVTLTVNQQVAGQAVSYTSSVRTTRLGALIDYAAPAP